MKMRTLTLAVIVTMVATACTTKENLLEGTWKRASLLDAHFEEYDDQAKGFVYEFKADGTYDLSYIRTDRYSERHERTERQEHGDWRLAAGQDKADVAALILRSKDGGDVKETTMRVVALTERELKVVTSEGYTASYAHP